MITEEEKHMKSTQRRAAFILIIALILTSIPLAGSPVSAEILPEVDAASTTATTTTTDQVSDPEYVEGDVIVCIKSGDNTTPEYSGENTNDMAEGLFSLLDSAEDLMDVTEAVKGSEEYGIAEDDSAKDGILSETSSADEEYALKYIHSDRYTTQEMIGMLKTDPDVLFIEPNYIYSLTDTEYDMQDNLIGEDTLISEEINDVTADAQMIEAVTESLKNTTDDILDTMTEDSEIPEIIPEGTDKKKPDLTQYQYAYLNKPGGMDVPFWNTQGYINAEGTVVAIMDTGVDYEHEDLKDVMWNEGLLFPELTALGGGMYGYNSGEKSSQNVSYTSNDPMDDQGHGTHCAGSAGAPWNGYGVSGTANGTKIMAVKTANDLGQFPSTCILKGFNYIKTAKECGVNIVAVNNSWGGPYASNSILLATQELAALNVVCCFASGNESADNDYISGKATGLRENDAVICVNANDVSANRSSFSNCGVRSSDLSAAGTRIMSTVPTGTGDIDPFQCEPVTDRKGNRMFDDFTGDTTYFTYRIPGSVTGGFAQDEKVIKLSNMNHFADILTISCNSLNNAPRHLALSARYGIDSELALLVRILKKDGEFQICEPQDFLRDDYNSWCIYDLPDDMELEHPQFRIIAYLRDQGKSTSDLYIRRISFTDDTGNYNYKNGTSMATPAVTGEVAVLAAKWPGDSASRRAARIVGSTVHQDGFSDISRTEGIANVRKALDCDYAPVVNRAWVDRNGLINISGYFFGKDKGSISITSGNAVIPGLTVTDWTGLGAGEWEKDGKNDEDIIKVDPGTNEITADEVNIMVTSSAGKTGSRWVTISGVGDSSVNASFYSRLSVPTPEDGELYKDFMDTVFYSSTALDGAIYYSGYISDINATDYITWKYTLPGNGREPVWTKLKKGTRGAVPANICAYNGMLVYTNADTWRISMYSPQEDMIYDTGISVPDIDGFQRNEAVIVNAQNELYLFMTLSKYNPKSGKNEPSRTDLYRLDIDRKLLLFLCTLDSIQKSAAVSAVKNDDGKMILTAIDKYDEKNLVREKITINGEQVSHSTVTINLNDTDYRAFGNRLRGTVTQYGIVFTGCTDLKNNMDNFLYKPEDNSVTPLKRQIVPASPLMSLATEYKGKTYFLGVGMYSSDRVTFAAADDEEFRNGSEHRDPLHYYGDDKTGKNPDITGCVDLNPANDGSVAIGKSIKITPEITEKNGNKITYTWYSKDSMIATVDQTGKVTGKVSGKTNICVSGRDSAGNVYEGSCPVTVYSLANGIKLSSGKLTVEGGDDIYLTAMLTPSEAAKDRVKWTVSVPASYPGAIVKTGEKYAPEEGSIASFKTKDVGGKVQVKITASATDGSKKSATCNVTIIKRTPDKPKSPVKKAALSDAGTIYLGTGMEHTISLVRVNPMECGDYSVAWKSSNGAVTISANTADKNKAVIKAVGNGTSKISAVITNSVPGGKTITVKGLTVRVLQSSVSGNNVKIFNNKKDITGSVSGNRLSVGKSLTLKALVYSGNTPVKMNKARMLWTSSDPEIATVNNGRIRAYREGEVTFKTTFIPPRGSNANTPVTASCTFYVYNPAKSLRIDRLLDDHERYIGIREIKGAAGETAKLEVIPIVAPKSDDEEEREDKEFVWTSSKTDVAEITENTDQAELKLKKAGKAVITCKVLDGSNKTFRFRVTVFERVKGLKITAKKLGSARVNTYNAKELTVSGLALKKTFVISPDLEPVTASNKQVVYMSTNPAAVRVSKNGQVKRYGAGNSDIYITTVDGGYRAVCHVIE